MEEEKKTESKDINKQSQQPKKKNKCCCIFLVCFFIILIIIVIYQIIRMPKNGSDTQVPTPTAQNQTAETTVDTSMSDEDLLDYFIEIITYNSATGARKTACRWLKNPIIISIKGDVNNRTIQALDDTISEFNAVSDTKLIRGDSGDIDVYFMPRAEFPKDFKGNDPKGYAHAVFNDACEITSAYFYVDDTYFEDSAQLTYHDALLTVTRHELFHVLGYYGHDQNQSRSCTTMSGIACLLKQYTQYDITAIKMLYNSNLPPGFNEDEIRQYFINGVPR